MSKPDWNDAPEWAEWLAADKTIGAQKEYWVWYECEPCLMNGEWWYSYEGEWKQDKRYGTEDVDHLVSKEKRP